MSKKKIKTFTPGIARQIQAHIELHKAEIFNGLDLAVSVSTVGGKYNRERLVIELGILPTDAENYRKEDLAKDQNIDKATFAKAVKSIMGATTLSKEEVSEYVDEWFNCDAETKPKIGAKVTIKKVKYNVIGIKIDRKVNVVLWCSKTKKVKIETLSKFVKHLC